MNKEQIRKNFAELYIGQNTEKLVKQYRYQKKKEMFLLVVAATIMVILCAVSDNKKSRVENNTVLRNGTEGNKEELALQMKVKEGKWEDVSLELYPKEYTKEELEQLFLEACEILPAYVQNKNESLDKVMTDLNLIQEIEGYPFLLKWESSNTQIIDVEGHILDSRENIDEVIKLTAYFQYENWESCYSLSVHVITDINTDFVEILEGELKKQESLTRESETFQLPETFRNTSLQWRYRSGNSALVLGILFVITVPLISYEKDRKIHKKTKIRKEQLQEDFSEFIAKLVMLMEVGMSIRGALFRIVEDEHNRQKRERRYLYRELEYICKQMKNGLPEKEAYELLGKRCNLACYKKLCGLLVQHLLKGGSDILDTLKKESWKAMEEQRRQIQRKGEEMGTKLLFPMMIMLGIVMVFLMVPALFSFQI